MAGGEFRILEFFQNSVFLITNFGGISESEGWW